MRYLLVTVSLLFLVSCGGGNPAEASSLASCNLKEIISANCPASHTCEVHIGNVSGSHKKIRGDVSCTKSCTKDSDCESDWCQPNKIPGDPAKVGGICID